MPDNAIKLKFVRVSAAGKEEGEVGTAISYHVPRVGERVIFHDAAYSVINCHYNVVPLKDIINDSMLGEIDELGDLMSDLAEEAHGEKILAVSNVTVFVEKIP